MGGCCECAGAVALPAWEQQGGRETRARARSLPPEPSWLQLTAPLCMVPRPSSHWSLYEPI